LKYFCRPDTAAGKVTLDDRPFDDQPPAESGHNLGTLLVVAGQDDASVFSTENFNGKISAFARANRPGLSSTSNGSPKIFWGNPTIDPAIL